MSLTARFTQLAERIAEEFRSVRAEIASAAESNFSGDYNDLTNTPKWIRIVHSTNSVTPASLPNSKTWNNYKETYNELGFYAHDTDSGSVGMTVIPTEFLPNSFQTTVMIDGVPAYSFLVEDTAQGQYTLELEANIEFSLFGR
jgi:hypothetical protein